VNEVIVGIDPSSRKLACCITIRGREEDIDMRTFTLSMDKAEACWQAFQWLRDIIIEFRNNGYRVIFAFLEDPVSGRGGITTLRMIAETNGALMAAGRSEGIEVIKVNNSSWKKGVLGNGNTPKTKIPGLVHKLWPAAWRLAKGDADLIDAACINRFGEGVVRLRAKIAAKNSRPLVRRKSA
jgi:Holliday junction resolvasome RuvABC endonuclease subunit